MISNSLLSVTTFCTCVRMWAYLQHFLSKFARLGVQQHQTSPQTTTHLSSFLNSSIFVFLFMQSYWATEAQLPLLSRRAEDEAQELLPDYSWLAAFCTTLQSRTQAARTLLSCLHKCQHYLCLTLEMGLSYKTPLCSNTSLPIGLLCTATQ